MNFPCFVNFFVTLGSTPRVTFSLLFRYCEFLEFRALWDLLPLTTVVAMVHPHLPTPEDTFKGGGSPFIPPFWTPGKL